MPTISLPTGEFIEVNSSPDECPRCNKHIHPKAIGAQVVEASRRRTLTMEAIFLCPNHECTSFFIAYYEQSLVSQGRGYSYVYKLVTALPRTPKKPAVFDGIISLSPNFYEIYSQASEADQRKLDQVAGVGYRKALEFLVKDYCCLKRPDDAEKIRATMLGPCIDRYVTDENIRDCAKLATWLGNDETHYVRKWTDRDINDLKALISLTLSWVETSIKTDQYRSAMLNGGS
ncbi:hypothetical protein LK540_05985 [Massilia sp. IC2-278]|uniref:hypothetical protein n=1 Tax=Massilia sp. IC2-278 TaxID=2887200 RepID=UPI001E4D1D8A|nr:hypothetical protein [Massilia sp. IC2-278]MCC2959978.1 hypothetical protein [Massilia sp. IC2-278]